VAFCCFGTGGREGAREQQLTKGPDNSGQQRACEMLFSLGVQKPSLLSIGLRHRSFYTQRLLHRSLYTEWLLHAEAFTWRDVFTQRSFYT